MANEEILVLKLELDATSTIKTTDDLIARNKELAKLIKKAPLEGEEGFEDLKDSIAAAKKEYALNRQEITKFNASLKDTDEAADSMVGLSKTLKKLEAEYKVLGKEQRDTFGKELKTEISKTRGDLKDLEADLGDYRRNVGNYPEVTKQNFFGLGNVVKDLGVAAAAALTFDLAKDAVKEIAAVTEEFERLRGTIQNLTNATGDELDSFTTDIAAISKTFSKDTNEVLLAANALSKNLGIGFNESLGLIEQGFLSGADANGEFLGSLEESSALIGETGASADEFIAIISQSAKDGIFSDKGVKTVAEAGKKLREQTDATTETVIALFGETEGKKLLGDIDTGEISIIDAVQKVSAKLGELPPQSKVVGESIKDIFGGAGAKAGLGFIKSLADIDEGTAGLIDTTNELVSSQISQLAAEKQLAQAQNETSKRFATLVTGAKNFGIVLQSFLFAALNKVFDILAPIGTAIGNLFAKFVEFGEKIGLVSEAGGLLQAILDGIQTGFFLIGFAIGKVIDGIGFLVDGVSFLYDNFTILQIAVDNVIGVFTFFVSLLTSLPATFNGVVAATKQLGTNLLNFFSVLALNAQIFAKEIEGIFTFDANASDQLNREIRALLQQQEQLSQAGQTVGEAFRQGFEESLSSTGAANAIVGIEQPIADAGAKSGTMFQKSFNEQINSDDAAVKLADSVPKALEEALQEGSIDALKEKVNELSSLLGTLVAGSDLFLSTAEKVKEATEQLNEAEELRKQALITDDELLKQKIENAAKLEAQLKVIASEALQQVRQQIDLELAESKIAAQKIRDQKLEDETLTAEQRKQVIEDFNNAVTNGEIEAEKQRLLLLQEGSVERLNLQAQIADSELQIRQKLYEEDVAAALAAEEKKQEGRERAKDIALEVATTVANAAFAIAKNNLDRETASQIEALDQETEARINSAAGNEEAQIRIKEEAEVKKQRIEADAAKKRKEQAIIQAVINGALAAITTLANTTVPYPAAFALLIPTAVAVAAQIAVISSAKFKRGKAPKKMSRGKWPKGKLHPQGGIPAIVDGIEPVEIESDEALINRDSSLAHTQLLSDINQDKGGIKFPNTRTLTTERRKQLRLYDTVTSSYPTLAKRGLYPRISSLIAKKRKLQEGTIATVNNTKVPVSGLSAKDVELIAKAAAAGTKAGLENARIFEQFKNQTAREDELNERAKV